MPDTELSFTLTAFVRELARAWQKLALYHRGHPERAQVSARVHAVLVGLAAPTGAIALGISREAILGPEERIAGGPVEPLARALYERGIAIIRFDEGVTAEEVETLLSLIPRWRPAENEIPLWDRLTAAEVGHIRAEPVDFSAVVATDHLPEHTDDEGRRKDLKGVFEEILAKLLADERFGSFGGTQAAQEGDATLDDILLVVRRVMERHGLDTEGIPLAGGQASSSAAETLSALSSLLGMAAASGVARAGDATTRNAAARHVRELLGAIPAGLRESVLDSALADLAGDGERAEAFAAVAGLLPAARVVSSLRRLRSEGMMFSSRILGLVEDLVYQAAPQLVEQPEDRDGESLAPALRAVFGEDDIDRILPSQRRLDRIALELRRSKPRPLAEEEMAPLLESLTEQKLVLQLCQTLLELVQRPVFSQDQVGAIAARMEEVVRALLASGRLVTAVRVVHGLKALADDPARGAAVREATEHCLERLARPDTMAALVEAIADLPDDGLALVRQLIDVLGSRAVRALLLALCEENDRGRRRHTFDLLASLGPTVAPQARALLGDEHWYVPRNMLALLRQGEQTIPLGDLRLALEHHDSRVRAEAVKCLGAVPEPLPAEVIRKALEDPDPKVAEGVARAIGIHRLERGADALVELLQRSDPLGRHTQLRIRALAALGELGRPEALGSLAHFFRGWLSVVTVDEQRAAFASLGGYPRDAREPWLKKGLRSPDREVREICKRLGGEGGA